MIFVMSETNKRQAQSPLSGDEDDVKRRIIMVDVPSLISLDEISDNEEKETTPGEGAELYAILEEDNKTKPNTDRPSAEKVDCLIDRMDNFMKCFANLHATVNKNQHTNQRKLKRLETAHNELINTVVKSAESTESRLETLESKLEESISANARLASKIAQIENEHDRRFGLQRHVNEENSRKINDLEIEQGYTNRNVFDCRSEVKERKLIISGLPESKDENVKLTALNSINRVVEAAIALKEPDAHLGGLRKLKMREIDNVFRIGKQAKGSRKRNISVTFLSVDDKDMVVKAKTDIKEDPNIKYYFNEDISNDGRILKTELKRIAQVANSQGKNAKVSGNKVTIGSKTYFSNELGSIPTEVKMDLKYEKEIEGGIVYKGEKSTFSNFFPAPFSYDGILYQHVEQYFQHKKATHHNDTEAEERIMRLSNPRRIKTVGDNIEEDMAWMEKRMMVLYHGVKAKFDQNWAIQEELISTKGKQLYEATTNPYFACGIGYDSKRWSDRDWSGENVAGLVLMKVRDELLNQPPATSDTTLGEIASQENLDLSMNVDAQDKSLDNGGTNVSTSISTSTCTMTDHTMEDRSQKGRALNSCDYNKTNVPDTDPKHGSPDYSSTPRARGYGSRGRRGGRGRGRGRGGRGYQPQRSNQTKYRRPQDRMSDSDRSFLTGDEPIKKSKQDKDTNLVNSLGLTEAQIEGLKMLGFMQTTK